MLERGQGEAFLERKRRASGGIPSILLNVRLQTLPNSQALSSSDLATDPLVHSMAGRDCTGARHLHNLASLVAAEILLLFLALLVLFVSISIVLACLAVMPTLTSSAKIEGETSCTLPSENHIR
jgi:hypothetical protein